MSRRGAWRRKFMVRDWRDDIKVGDVIKEGNGVLRVVRRASYHSENDGFLWGITLAIRSCSWTGRCYTVLTRSDLASRGFSPTGATWPLDSDFDRMIDAAIGQRAKRAVHRDVLRRARHRIGIVTGHGARAIDLDANL